MAQPYLSITVPIYNECDNVANLVERTVAVGRALGRPFELILVDDGSADETMHVLRPLVGRVPELVVVKLARNFGQTQALQAGFDHARGEIIVTLDGDLQNDPADIPRLVAEVEAGADVVSGWRKDRQDKLVVRKVPSWIANRLIQRVTGVKIHDQGCALKAYRLAIVRELGLYSDMHRFVAILSMSLGANVKEIVVRHHPRTAGVSKYGLSRVLKVIADLLTIQMITWFQERPLRWFALLGVPALLGASAATLGAITEPTGAVVWSSVALICSTTFVSCLLCGLLGELIIETGGTPQGRPIVVHDLLETPP